MAASVLLVAGLMVGCKPKALGAADGSARAGNYFQTSFQSECQFIVQAIVSDLAEQIYYAANHRLPDAKTFSVTATEKPGSPVDAPEYELQINLGSKPVKSDLVVNGPIWSPQVYQAIARQLAQEVALNPGALPQRYYRIYFRGPSRRKVASQQRHPN